MEKVWLVIQESNVDGETLVNVTPCASYEIANQVMKDEVNTLLTESKYFRDVHDYPQDFIIEESDSRYFIKDTISDSYEEITIEEKEIRK